MVKTHQRMTTPDERSRCETARQRQLGPRRTDDDPLASRDLQQGIACARTRWDTVKSAALFHVLQKRAKPDRDEEAALRTQSHMTWH